VTQRLREGGESTVAITRALNFAAAQLARLRAGASDGAVSAGRFVMTYRFFTGMAPQLLATSREPPCGVFRQTASYGGRNRWSSVG